MGRRGRDGAAVARSNVVVRQEEEEVDRATISRPKRRHASSPFFDNSHSPHSAITFRVRFSLSLSLLYIFARPPSFRAPPSSIIPRVSAAFSFHLFSPFSPFLFAKNGEGTSCGNIIADRRFRRGCTRIVNNAREVGTAGNRLTFAMKEREREHRVGAERVEGLEESLRTSNP